MPNRAQIMLAEAIGTFTLTFIGILAITNGMIAGGPAASAELVTVAFAHGLAIAVMVAALGAVSGGHFNPAVTFGFVVTGRLSLINGVLYWVAQILGALAASFLIGLMAGFDAVDAGNPAVAENVGTGMAIVLEAVATFFLVLVVFGSAVDERAPKSVYPFAIGLTVTLGIMAIGPLTGGALNPARAVGPAIASGAFDRHFVFWVGPMIGGALGGAVQHFFLMRGAPSPEVAAHGGPAPTEKRL